MMTSQLERVDVILRGSIPQRARQYATEKMSVLMRLAPSPVLRAMVKLTRTHHRAGGEHVLADAILDVNGRPVRAQVAAASSHEAIDLVQNRLRRKLSRLSKHPARPGGQRVHRPRPPALVTREPEVVQHRTYEPATALPDEAAWDMELMGYDFQLFTDAASGCDTLVYRNGHPGYGIARLAEQASLTLTGAITALDTAGLPYLFYRDAESGRGRVLYRRHDGNYGLITP